MLKSICRCPGCNKTADFPLHYCEAHSYMEADVNDYTKAMSKYATSYSNLYRTKQWRELEKKHLKEEPFCVVCGSPNNLVVDHRVAHRGDVNLFFDENNLQTLCKSCHDRKTREEIKQRQKEGARRRELERRYGKSW